MRSRSDAAGTLRLDIRVNRYGIELPDSAELKTDSSLAKSDILTIGWVETSLWESGESETMNNYSQYSMPSAYVAW